MPGPLSGIRVLDFGRYIAGPYCAALLADMGAEVIRVERREGGEDRFLVPLGEGSDGALFIGMNRNKKSLTLDPGHPDSIEIKRRLVARADVVIANLPVDVLRKLGLDYDSLKAIKPDIILTMISAFGSTGPYAKRVGFDSVVQAMSGAMSLTGFAGMPVRSVAPFEDFGTALHAAFGTMIALYERRSNGKGQVVEGSLLSTGMLMMQSLLAEREVTGIIREQRGNTSFHAAPADAYQTRDGWIMVQAVSQPIFVRWAQLVGAASLINDVRLKDDLGRGDNYQVINDAMSDWTKGRTSEEAIRELEAARIPCGPVNSLREALDDPQVAARGIMKYLDYPGIDVPVPVPTTPVILSETPGEIRHRAPLLGEHSNDILLELGFTTGEITDFRSKAVV